MRATHWWPYELQPLGGGRAKAGTLLRWESSEGVGYSDLLSWDLFQDPPLNVLMDWLRQGSSHPLLAQTKAAAIQDLATRVRGISLFSGIEVPASHWLCRTFSPAELAAAADEGFGCFKLKVSDDTSALAAWCAIFQMT